MRFLCTLLLIPFLFFAPFNQQWDNSNEQQVTLKDVQFDLSGQFYCEVSTDTPIFTKASADELMSVFCA